ncbi:LuxR family transcriptional regulator [Labrenzia sp. DG1229]|uniref:helix-turn-helix transcriptional regulator n=1 Tax=Labrenzia sp. DG1229 TaxID=681847 RepID=UPI000A01A840|nr:LuxR family transcriptional regulator [Labrenzia sp. DG1229]
MISRLEDFSNSVLGAEDPLAVWNIATSFFESFGFIGSMYGIRHLHTTPNEKNIRFSSALSDWKASYMAHKDYERDPLFIYAPQLPSVFFTGVNFLEDHPYLREEDVAVIRRAESFDLTSGIALKMAGGEDGVVRGWNLIGDLSRPEIMSLNDAHGGVLHVCAALADQKISQTVTRPDAYLTNREKECLILLANGKRTAQIADKLNIQSVTVDLHMRNAREKLGARTREQALAVAIVSNLLPL